MFQWMVVFLFFSSTAFSQSSIKDEDIPHLLDKNNLLFPQTQKTIESLGIDHREDVSKGLRTIHYGVLGKHPFNQLLASISLLNPYVEFVTVPALEEWLYRIEPEDEFLYVEDKTALSPFFKSQKTTLNEWQEHYLGKNYVLVTSRWLTYFNINSDYVMNLSVRLETADRFRRGAFSPMDGFLYPRSASGENRLLNKERLCLCELSTYASLILELREGLQSDPQKNTREVRKFVEGIYAFAQRGLQYSNIFYDAITEFSNVQTEAQKKGKDLPLKIFHQTNSLGHYWARVYAENKSYASNVAIDLPIRQGGQNLYPHEQIEKEHIQKYSQMMRDVRLYRVYFDLILKSVSGLMSGNSEKVRLWLSQDFTQKAIYQVEQEKIHTQSLENRR